MIDLMMDDQGKALGQTPGKMTERAPGIFVRMNPKVIGKMCLARWRNNGDGTHSLVPVTTRLVAINERTLKLIGMEGGRNTIMRLSRACPPFIRVVQRAPRIHLLDLDSLEAHDQKVLDAQAEGRAFWTGDNRRRYIATLEWKEE